MKRTYLEEDPASVQNELNALAQALSIYIRVNKVGDISQQLLQRINSRFSTQKKIIGIFNLTVQDLAGS